MTVVRVTLFVIIVSMAVILSIRMVMPVIVIMFVSAVASAESSWAHLRVMGTPATVASSYRKKMIKIISVRAVMTVMTVMTVVAMVTAVIGADFPMMTSMMTFVMMVVLVREFKIVPIKFVGLGSSDDGCKSDSGLEHLVYKI